jgi:cytochrome P450
MSALVAGHDTTSMLMVFMVRYLASDPATLAATVQGKVLRSMNSTPSTSYYEMLLHSTYIPMLVLITFHIIGRP